MCGFAGFYDAKPERSTGESRQIGDRMAGSLTHRGPDDQGLWLSSAGDVLLAHRRLSILDTSHAGHQPMVSSCGKIVLAFNGEIYNYRELRKLLEKEGRRFTSDSDTEVLVEAIAQWGVLDTLKQLVGMFAFATWNTADNQLVLARDRLGIKPLYFGQCGSSFLFGSELKALRQHPNFDDQLNRGAIDRFMSHNYVPAPWSIYTRIEKLEPGTLLTVSNAGQHKLVWWDSKSAAEQARAVPFAGNHEQAINKLESVLADAVAQRMIADVPLGAFLSGGIDSSLIVALMQAQSDRPVKTFTIGFEETGYNEATHAKAVAKHLGTDHTEHYVTAQEARDVIPKLATMFDEPFADSSQIPTFLVSQLARQDVTVSLSGDGGDELFGGYHRYQHINKLWHRLNRIPARSLIGSMCGAAAKLASGRWRERFSYRAQLLKTQHGLDLYRKANLHWQPGSVVLRSEELPTRYWDADEWLRTAPTEWFKLGNFDPEENIEQWMWLDAATYLPDDILTKVDRASMAVGLEARVPLLDHRVYELAWSLPMDFKVGDGSDGKRILKDLLARFVPRELFDRPKMGFGVPIGDWLRGPLRDWAEDLLSLDRLTQDGIFAAQPIREKWQAHLNQTTDWAYHLWDVLMFQSWLDSQSGVDN